jgi:hypothetical protein
MCNWKLLEELVSERFSHTAALDKRKNRDEDDPIPYTLKSDGSSKEYRKNLGKEVYLQGP